MLFSFSFFSKVFSLLVGRKTTLVSINNLISIIIYYIIIRVRSAFSLVASCVLLKYTRTDDVN